MLTSVHSGSDRARTKAVMSIKAHLVITIESTLKPL